MIRSAASRGHPPTAGVGWRAAANSSTSAGGLVSSASTEVARCWMLVKRTTSGGRAETVLEYGCSAPTTKREASACSAASLALAISRSASMSSSASLAPRATEPAIGWAYA